MKKAVVFILVMLIGVSLCAENLTLEKAKEIALQNNPDLLSKEQAKKSITNFNCKSLLLSK